MQITLTGFGYTFVEGDHPVWLIASVAAGILLANVYIFGKYVYPPTEVKDD